MQRFGVWGAAGDSFSHTGRRYGKTATYVANVINREMVNHLVRADIDAVMVDLETKIEASILVTQYLKQIGIPKIIVKAEIEEHGEILKMNSESIIQAAGLWKAFFDCLAGKRGKSVVN